MQFRVATSLGLISLAAAQSCTDSATWFKTNVPGKDCAWVSGKPSKRCNVKGYEGSNLVKAKEACQNVCGECETENACTNADDWYKKGNPAKNCGWVAKRSSRCETKGQDGTKAKNACYAACTDCGAETEELEPVTPGCGSSLTWHKPNAPDKNCLWLPTNPSKLALRCTFNGVDPAGKDPEAKVVASDACPLQCSVACGAVFEDEEGDEDEDGDEDEEKDGDEDEDGDEDGDEDEEKDGDEDGDEDEEGDEDEDEDGDEDGDEDEEGDEDEDEEEDGDEEEDEDED